MAEWEIRKMRALRDQGLSLPMIAQRFPYSPNAIGKALARVDAPEMGLDKNCATVPTLPADRTAAAGKRRA